MIVSLGQITADVVTVTTSQKKTGYRLMALQYAVREVLAQAQGVVSFPGRFVDIPADRFNALVTAIAQTANQPGWATNPGYTWIPAFTEAEATKHLRQRGYRPATPGPGAIVTPPSPYVSPIATTVIPPRPQPIVIQPQPQPIVIPPQPQPYQPPPPLYEPEPLSQRVTIPDPEPPPVEAAGIDTNAILWLVVGAVVGGLVLGSMTKQRGGRYERTY